MKLGHSMYVQLALVSFSVAFMACGRQATEVETSNGSSNSSDSISGISYPAPYSAGINRQTSLGLNEEPSTLALAGGCDSGECSLPSGGGGSQQQRPSAVEKTPSGDKNLIAASGGGFWKKTEGSNELVYLTEDKKETDWRGQYQDTNNKNSFSFWDKDNKANDLYDVKWDGTQWKGVRKAGTENYSTQLDGTKFVSNEVFHDPKKGWEDSWAVYKGESQIGKLRAPSALSQENLARAQFQPQGATDWKPLPTNSNISVPASANNGQVNFLNALVGFFSGQSSS